jgi:uncharacterized repeat protein (TIGR03806 family)
MVRTITKLVVNTHGESARLVCARVRPRTPISMNIREPIEILLRGSKPPRFSPSPFLRERAGVRVLLLAFLSLLLTPIFPADEQPFGLEKRIPWTTSHVIGSPEPPLPYTTEKTFTNITWKSPLFAIAEPGTDSLLIVQEGGQKDRPSKIFRIRDEASTSEAPLFFQMPTRLIYSVQFHPGYRTNGWLFVFSNGPTPESERTNRISRFTVDSNHHCDSASEKIIIQWHSQGHDGGGIVFGHDGMLYISTGDGTSDSDGWDSGQTLNDLLGAILRIDVDHPSETDAYAVPKDNPFLNYKDARPEIWAYGLRNPWRLTIDDKTGQIWVGVNGQDLWETAHLVRRGENYGWSVYEGSHPFYLNRKRGPTPIVLPTIEHPHSEMRSLTGGVVYYGDEFPELNGAYIYGDYSTGQIWGARHDGIKLTWHEKLAETQLAIAAFSLDHHGGLLIVDHSGNGIYRLKKRAKEAAPPKFPTRLSETGIFSSTREHKIEPGIIPYSVNAPAWNDGASAERFIGLPNDMQIEVSSGVWNMTNGAVLAQTLSLDMEQGNPASRRRIETRLLTRQSGQWVGYSYRWNDDEFDATLVPAKGEEKEFQITKAVLGKQQQLWRYPSRAECMACHSRAANFVLAVNDLQMNREHDYGTVHDNQIRTLDHIGLFTRPKNHRETSKLVDPYDTSKNLEARARSYLHVNCSVCHVEAGGGNSMMELGIGTALDRMRLIGARPQHDTFGIDNAMLVSPGDVGRSILFQRLARRGPGQMPPLVSAVIDDHAVVLFKEWIGGMTAQQQFVKDWKMEDFLPALDQLKTARSFDEGRKAFQQTGCVQCHRFAGTGGSVGPDLTDVAKRLAPRDLLESILLPSKVITEGFATTEIETASGDIITGFIEREDDQSLVIRPASGTEQPIAIAKKQIARRTLSKVSNMPAGIANTLTQTQILDLLAYLISNGDPAHPAFTSTAH